MLSLADELVLSNPDGRLSAEQRAALAVHFSDAEVLELGMTAGILSGMAKFLFVFDLVTRETSCPVVRPGAAH